MNSITAKRYALTNHSHGPTTSIRTTTKPAKKKQSYWSIHWYEQQTPPSKTNPQYQILLLYDVFFQLWLLLQKKINDPFPPFQQQRPTTQPFGDSPGLETSLQGVNSVPSLGGEFVGEFAMWKKRRFPKIHPEKNRSNDIYIIYV